MDVKIQRALISVFDKTGVAEFAQALADMGVTADMLAAIDKAPNVKEGQRLLEEAKAVCKKGFRKLAMKWHPDVNGGDAKKTKNFKFVLKTYEEFIERKYRHPSSIPDGTSLSDLFKMRMEMSDDLAAAIRRRSEQRQKEFEILIEQEQRRIDPLYDLKKAATEVRRRERRQKAKEGEARACRARAKAAAQERQLPADRGVWKRAEGREIPHPDRPERKK